MLLKWLSGNAVIQLCAQQQSFVWHDTLVDTNIKGHISLQQLIPVAPFTNMV